MPDLRAFFNSEWIRYQTGVAVSSGTVISVSGIGDATTAFHADRRVRMPKSDGTYIFGTISSSSYAEATGTSVTITWDSGDATQAEGWVEVALLTATNLSVPGNIARDTEVTAAMVAHVALADPHTQYLLESAYTAADVFAKVLTLDGSSSLLDADLLDGSHASAFAAVSHVHAGGDITTGTVAAARIDSAIARLASPTFSGTITTPLTASKAMVTGASSELAVSATTATELGYVAGVTSAIQTQINTLMPKAGGTFTGKVTINYAGEDGLYVYDTTTQAAGVGAKLTFGGAYTGTTTTQAGEIGVDKDNSTAGEFGFSMFFTTRLNGGSLTEQLRILSTGQIGIGINPPTSYLHVKQRSATGAQPVIAIEQADIDQHMLDFICTIGTGNGIEAIAAKTLTTTHFIMIQLPGPLTRYIPCGTIA